MDKAKAATTKAKVKDCRAALAAITQAVAAGEPVALADAKVLEAAGCWLRRNATGA